ncbi:MAG TPA: molybdopterin-dependent oxidoreductase [Propionibacteriaceae bacterium]|nr:molybdopterin-dependent oxidoreductase [Propionibacteriaceae bacterium]
MLRRAIEGAEPSAARSTAWWARLSGVAAGVAGLAINELSAALIDPPGAAVPGVGETIIGLLPAGLINFGKDTLGAADKPVLLALVILFVLAFSALAGQLEHRRRYAGAGVFALLATLGLIGVSDRVSSVRGYLPTVIGLLVGYVLLHTLIERLGQWRPRRAATEADGGARWDARRRFLRVTILTVAVAAVAGITGRVLSGAANSVAQAREKLRLPPPARPATPVPAGADLGVAGLSPYVTPNDDFYRIDTALQVPVISPEDWSLKVTGMVENEFELSYAELSALPLEEHLATLACVSNEVGGDLIGNALWRGYPIRHLLARAKPKLGADMVLSESDDGFTAGTPLQALTDPDRQAMLAIGMNGEPLPLVHGFPVRMVVPGLYGYVSATKWVVELKVTSFARDTGYWTPLGWSAKGPIKLASRIDTPRRSTVDAGIVVVAGVAWCQHVGVSKVEVRIDDGDWQQAQLAETAGPDTWRQWKLDWQAPPGTHTVTVRATDALGNLQVEAEAPVAPDGATGYHTRTLEVR